MIFGASSTQHSEWHRAAQSGVGEEDQMKNRSAKQRQHDKTTSVRCNPLEESIQMSRTFI
jgi:hypothetical protein